MRVERTFAFLDLCGFTAFTEQHGDAEAVAVLGHLRTVLRAEAEQRGVRVTKWLGDGAMLSGVDAAAVIACALVVRDVVQRDGRLALRGGVSTGKVIMFEGDDYIGATVNLAARLCQSAASGQLLMAGNLETDMPPRFRPGLPRRTAIPGIAEPVEVVAVEATGPRT